MVKSSVGRRDHSLGYVRGNYFWQSHFDNNQEMALRNNTGSIQRGLKRSEKTKELLRISHAGQGDGRILSQETKDRISKSMKEKFA
jgi:hypothetical protein